MRNVNGKDSEREEQKSPLVFGNKRTEASQNKRRRRHQQKKKRQTDETDRDLRKERPQKNADESKTPCSWNAV